MKVGSVNIQNKHETSYNKRYLKLACTCVWFKNINKQINNQYLKSIINLYNSVFVSFWLNLQFVIS